MPKQPMIDEVMNFFINGLADSFKPPPPTFANKRIFSIAGTIMPGEDNSETKPK